MITAPSTFLAGFAEKPSFVAADEDASFGWDLAVELNGILSKASGAETRVKRLTLQRSLFATTLLSLQLVERKVFVQLERLNQADAAQARLLLEVIKERSKSIIPTQTQNAALDGYEDPRAFTRTLDVCRVNSEEMHARELRFGGASGLFSVLAMSVLHKSWKLIGRWVTLLREANKAGIEQAFLSEELRALREEATRNVKLVGEVLSREEDLQNGPQELAVPSHLPWA